MHLLPGPTLFFSGTWSQKLKYKNMLLPRSCPDSIRQLSTWKLLRWNCIYYSPYLVLIWHLEPQIIIQKYVTTLIVSGFYKAVLDFQTVMVTVHLLPGTTHFLSGIWNQKLKYKNMFLPRSCPVSIRQLSTWNLLRWKWIYCSPYPVLIWHLKREIEIQIYVSKRMLSGFYKAVVHLQTLKGKVHLLPGTTRFLSGIWNQKLKCKNMFLPRSCPVSIR